MPPKGFHDTGLFAIVKVKRDLRSKHSQVNTQCRRTKINIGGRGLPVLFFLIQYTVIEEIYYRLTITGGLQRIIMSGTQEQMLLCIVKISLSAF